MARHSKVCERTAARIRAAHKRFGLSLGWRFLYCPDSLLTAHPGILFLGLNPGGERFAEQACVASGNAYCVEKWSRDGEELRAQVKSFFTQLSLALGERPVDGEALLHKTLTGNLVPFRSPTWEVLPHHKRGEILAFSRALWAELLAHVTPALIICMGRVPFAQVRRILRARACRVVGRQRFRTGWGDVSFRIERYVSPAWGTVLGYLPHLSRFPLVGRPESTVAVARFCQGLARAASERPNSRLERTERRG